MGNIIKINIYVEMKRNNNNNKFKLETVEENILEYNSWLKMNKREDKIENYERFLQAQ